MHECQSKPNAHTPKEQDRRTWWRWRRRWWCRDERLVPYQELRLPQELRLTLEIVWRASSVFKAPYPGLAPVSFERGHVGRLSYMVLSDHRVHHHTGHNLPLALYATGSRGGQPPPTVSTHETMTIADLQVRRVNQAGQMGPCHRQTQQGAGLLVEPR